MSNLQGYFLENYGPLEGSDWLLALPEYEIQAFARYGFAESGYGRKGGKVRARTAQRDRKGRFTKDEE